jgi:antitoxin ParD1/3/4
MIRAILRIMKTEPMRTLTISLTPQQANRIRTAVETGAYASNSEVLRDALRL